jgi:putative FmdB family regulatory protein
MPLYEYRCDACEHSFEALQKMSDEPLIHCPACDEATLRKLVSAGGFRLKGDGWYETDFKRGNKRNLADSGKKESSTKKSDAA